MTHVFHFYRENSSRWFFDDKEKNIFHEEMVEGADDLISAYAEGKPFIDVEVTDSPSNLNEYVKLMFMGDHMSGVIYKLADQTAWLCPTFWKYFAKPAPKHVFFKVLDV